MQVILVGDFYQLPLISNELYDDFGHYCFEAKFFNSIFCHKLVLNEVHRQEERELILAVNSLEKGIINDDVVAFLQSLFRSLLQNISEAAVHLFAGNLDSDVFNYQKLRQLPGEMTTFACKEEGDHHFLNKILASKHLGLNPLCNVMLILTLSDTLVNSLIGTLSKIKSDSVDVDFVVDGKTVTVNVVKHTFTTYDPVKKKILAKREQLPMKLSYGITIHKFQGMSLNSVIFHCELISFPGQLGVAIGRAANCFKNIKDEIVSSSLKEFADTPVENVVKGMVILFKNNIIPLNEWFTKQHTCIKDRASSVFKGSENITNKQINAFYTQFNRYLSGEEFISSVYNLLSKYNGLRQNLTTERKIQTSVMFNIQKKHLHDLSIQVTCNEMHQLRTLPEEISPVKSDM
ncbi:PIF1 [Mytilus coruscus]|uniref:PIF1 n=1 Tax=Mytilus coruscus TaxID=42192 RepID=A0A6J8BWR3_MYTCO|nr:PIF1 [Mytilus coruscus]